MLIGVIILLMRLTSSLGLLMRVYYGDSDILSTLADRLICLAWKRSDALRWKKGTFVQENFQ